MSPTWKDADEYAERLEPARLPLAPTPRKKRAKRKFFLDVRVPDRKGSYRIRIEADDTEYSDDVLDAWVPVCEEILKLATAHMKRRAEAKSVWDATEPQAPSTSSPDKPTGASRSARTPTPSSANANIGAAGLERDETP
jgi:hypothetical protein